MSNLPETITVGMKLVNMNPVFGTATERLEVVKIDEHGIWLMRECGVMVRQPVTRQELVDYDYELAP